MNPFQSIADFAQEHALPWDERARERFALYTELLERFNTSMNLIGPMDRDELVRSLLLDSIVAAAAAPPRGSILDVGSGAGLPGIPLSILYPDVPATLVEPRRKRATFLKIAAKRLELEHLSVVNERLEDAPDGSYDYVISKAFRPPVNWLTDAAEWRTEDGVIVCMTRAHELEALEARAAEIGLAHLSTARPPFQRNDDAGPRATFVFGRA